MVFKVYLVYKYYIIDNQNHNKENTIQNIIEIKIIYFFEKFDILYRKIEIQKLYNNKNNVYKKELKFELDWIPKIKDNDKLK